MANTLRLLRVPFLHDTVRFVSPMSRDEAVAALKGVTDPKPHYSLFDPDIGEFRGPVAPDAFHISWKSGGRYRPPLVLAGETRAGPDGCEIDIEVRAALLPLLGPATVLMVAMASFGWPATLFGTVVRLVIWVIVLGIFWLMKAATFRSRVYDLKVRLGKLWQVSSA